MPQSLCLSAAKVLLRCMCKLLIEKMSHMMWTILEVAIFLSLARLMMSPAVLATCKGEESRFVPRTCSIFQLWNTARFLAVIYKSYHCSEPTFLSDFTLFLVTNEACLSTFHSTLLSPPSNPSLWFLASYFSFNQHLPACHQSLIFCSMQLFLCHNLLLFIMLQTKNNCISSLVAHILHHAILLMFILKICLSFIF